MNALDQLVEMFRIQGDALAGAMIPAGHNLVGHLAVVALVLGIAWPMLDRIDLSPVIGTLIALIATAFIAIWLINETTTISRSIDAALIRIAATATGVSSDLTPGQVWEQGLVMIETLNASAAASALFNGWAPYTAILNAIVALGLEAGVAALAISFAFYKILAYTIVPLSIPLLALVVLPLTRSFAMGVFRFWISTAVALMTIVFFAGMATHFQHNWIVALNNACHLEWRTIVTSTGPTFSPGPERVQVCSQSLSFNDAAPYMFLSIAYALIAIGSTYSVSHAIGVWAGSGLEHAGMALFATNQVSRVATSATNNSAAQSGVAARNAAWAQVKQTIQNSIP